MKNISSLLFLFMTSLVCNLSFASHIQPTSSLNYSKPMMGKIVSPITKTKTGTKTDTTKDSKETKTTLNEKTFDQELQWRILNLLAQQLFQNNNDALVNDIFSNNWLYSTQTFSVDISSINPDFYLIKIIDSHLGSATQLEIPRL